MEKETLKQLIDKYVEFDFNYLDCGSNKLSNILPTGETIYIKRQDEEIKLQATKRKKFEKLVKQILDEFSQQFKTREQTTAPIGADHMAMYVSKNDEYLIDYAKTLCDAAIKKHDPNMLTVILHLVELPVYYSGITEQHLKALIQKMLPEIALACDHDTSIYIDNIVNRFCLLSRPASEYKRMYARGFKSHKQKLISSFNKTDDLKK